MTVAQIILEQLGGNKFKAMTGADHFYEDEKGMLTFMFKGFCKANICTIFLNTNDLYDVTFAKYRKGKRTREVIGKFTNIFNYDLQEVFRSFTGLQTHL